MTVIFFSNQPFPAQLTELARTLYMTIFAMLAVWFLWLCSKLPVLQKTNHGSVFLDKLSLSGLLFAMVLVEWFGFHQLVEFLVTALILTLGLAILVVGACRFISVLYQWVDDNKYSWVCS